MSCFYLIALQIVFVKRKVKGNFVKVNAIYRVKKTLKKFLKKIERNLLTYCSKSDKMVRCMKLRLIQSHRFKKVNKFGGV